MYECLLKNKRFFLKIIEFTFRKSDISQSQRISRSETYKRAEIEMVLKNVFTNYDSEKK